MADESQFGGQPDAFGAGFSSPSFGGGAVEPDASAEVTPRAGPAADAGESPSALASFGQGIGKALGAPQYRAPDPEMSTLDQSADMLQQRVQRANQVAANPVLQFFNPEGVTKAREFIPKAAEELQKIRTQQAAIKAGRVQAETLGLAPGDVPDEATMAERVTIAQSKAVKGDLKVWKGLQAVDPKAAEAIQDQAFEAAGGHLTNAQYAFDSLAGMQNEGQYTAKLAQLRKEGKLGDLEALGLKVPGSFEAFNATKSREGAALRDARMGIDAIRNKLEERNTYQPMEEKEAKTYTGRMTTAYGDQITNGTWGRNASTNARGLIVNGAADPRDLGTKFTLATPDQRKAIKEEFEGAIPKTELEKMRAFDRTYSLATKDAKGNDLPADKINTNPNVQQAIAESLAANLRGGMGGANVGLLNIETGKRGYVQGLLDKIKAGYAGGMNAISGEDLKPYLTNLTQKQVRDVLDTLKAYTDSTVDDRAKSIATRAGALGLDPSAFGWGKNESVGVVADAIKAGREEQIARMSAGHQAIGGGDGVFQLGAQRPGAGAVSSPQGTQPTTQLPGQPPVATPVQQATQPQPAPQPNPQPAPQPAPVSPPAPANPGGGNPPPAAAPGAPAPAPTSPAGGGAPTAPITIAGQTVNASLPPGVSPTYMPALQRIESGKEKDPWTATAGKGPDGKPASSASGAFQMLDSTWNENKPAGATATRAKDATPQQQMEAAAKFAAGNAATLQKNGLPVNDVNMYVAHNLGGAGGSKLLTADPNADAREVVGEKAARNNPLFFRGRPTVAKVLERYKSEMEALPDEGPKPKSPLPGAAATEDGKPGLMTRVRNWLSAGAAPEGSPNPSDASLSPAERQKATQAAAGAAPAALSTVGSVAGGAAAGPPGAVAGGAVGGGAGQALKDYLQGNDQSPAAIAKESALGGVLGITSAARPVAAAAARVVGSGAVQAGAAAAEGKSATDVVEEGLTGAGAAAGGELFGRALGMAGHKVFSLFGKDAQKTVREAAGKYATAEETLAKEAPTIPGVGGAAGTKNPAYEAAERQKETAERVLKDAGLKPEEAAYAHKVSSEGVPRQEAEAARPGAIEKERIGAGYQELEGEVAEKGRGAVKPAPKLADGPIAAVDSKAVSAAHKELAERVEMAITAPAPDWKTKWTQLQEARSDLLQAERDALASTVTGKTQTAKDMRTLADTVRKQQEKAAKYVFGEKDGEAFMQRLKVLDTRYRNLMEVTNGMDLAKAAALKGEAGREAERKFVAFAHDDPQALSAYRAMRGAKGDIAEATVPWTVAAEGLPVVGKVVKVAKLGAILRDWARERAAGSPVRFTDLVTKLETDAAKAGKDMRDVLGTAGAHAAAM